MPDTLAYYQARKAELERQLVEMGLDKEGGHQRQEHHDNAGAVLVENQARAELQRIGDLRGVQLIEPPEQVTEVVLGARVFLEFPDSQESLEAIIGAPDEVQASIPNRMVISNQSPIGKALIGKQAGQEITYRVGTTQKVVITSLTKA